MREIKAKFGEKQYDIFITDSFDSLNELLTKYEINEKVLLVTDSKVGELYQGSISNLTGVKSISMYQMDGGEENKTLDTVSEIYDICYKNEFNRASAIIALGGGIVGDTAGFAASTFMRGIKFVQVPTTIIADVDSSVGGKVGVNHKGIKNMIGSFYHPEFIYINTSVLKTLNKRHIVAGMAEVIKYAVVYDLEFFNYLKGNVSGLLNLEIDNLDYIIDKCISFKIRAVENDVYDNNERQLLNFGHSIGHVIESMSDYSVYHGEAVALGMMFECALSNICGMMSKDEMEQVFDIISSFGLNRSFDFSNTSRIFEVLKHDKKADRGKIKFIIPQRIGSAFVSSDIKEQNISKAFGLLENYWGKI